MCISNVLVDLWFTKQRIKKKKSFARVICSVLVVNMYWQNIKKNCLTINGAQSVRLAKGTKIIEFLKLFQTNTGTI